MANQNLSARLNVGVAQIVVPGTSSGLVSASGLTGNTTGSAIAAGYVGEVITFTSRTVAGVTTGFTANTSALANLSAGVWLIFLSAAGGGGASVTGYQTLVSANTASDSTGLGTSTTNYDPNFGGQFPTIPVPVTLSVATQIYAKARTFGANCNVVCAGFAVRIA